MVISEAVSKGVDGGVAKDVSITASFIQRDIPGGEGVVTDGRTNKMYQKMTLQLLI